VRLPGMWGNAGLSNVDAGDCGNMNTPFVDVGPPASSRTLQFPVSPSV
jgi:hypothetical protein